MYFSTYVLGASTVLLQDSVQATRWLSHVEVSFLGSFTGCGMWDTTGGPPLGHRDKLWSPGWRGLQRRARKWAKHYGQDCSLEAVGACYIAGLAKSSKSVDSSLPVTSAFNNEVESWVFSVSLLCLFIQRMSKKGAKTVLKTIMKVACFK